MKEKLITVSSQVGQNYNLWQLFHSLLESLEFQATVSATQSKSDVQFLFKFSAFSYFYYCNLFLRLKNSSYSKTVFFIKILYTYQTEWNEIVNDEWENGDWMMTHPSANSHFTAHHPISKSRNVKDLQDVNPTFANGRYHSPFFVIHRCYLVGHYLWFPVHRFPIHGFSL